MDISRAFLVLGAEPSDTWETVKRKYRQMMLLYHPDTAGEDEASLYLAQQINEAYDLIKTHISGDGIFRDSSTGFSQTMQAAQAAKAGGSAGREAGGASGGPVHWETGENTQAYCQRTIYEGTGMYDAGEVIWKEQTLGRYNWDPYREDFRVYARSVNEACSELLALQERKYGYYDRDELPDPQLQDTYRLQIFHLLMQQFVRPMVCLDRLAEDHERDPEIPGKYAFECAAGLKGAAQLKVLSHVQTGDMLQLMMDGEKLTLLTREGLCLGHLSFHEDSLYYVISLLLRSGGAVLEPQVRQIREERHTRPVRAHISLRLHVRLQDEQAQRRQMEQMTAEGNRRIAALLAEYCEELDWN